MLWFTTAWRCTARLCGSTIPIDWRALARIAFVTALQCIAAVRGSTMTMDLEGLSPSLLADGQADRQTT
eukprot:2874178-Rhodomonas_salina.1